MTYTRTQVKTLQDINNSDSFQKCKTNFKLSFQILNQILYTFCTYNKA